MATHPPPRALAIGAHPDDIEFLMAGTLLLLRERGCEIHYLNLASGSCGSAVDPAAKVRRIRRAEARAAAKVLGAVFHDSLVDDLEIYYERSTLKRLAAVVRQINPAILLVPSPVDYMEDHTNTCRLAVTAAFVRGMRNFVTTPRRPPVESEVTLYHAMPHGLRDPLRRRVIPGMFVDTSSVQAAKQQALSCHRSQQDWLGTSQKLNQYLQTMEDFAKEVGRISRKFKFAEGWRRHLHYGFCRAEADPLAQALSPKCLVDPAWEEQTA